HAERAGHGAQRQPVGAGGGQLAPRLLLDLPGQLGPGALAGGGRPRRGARLGHQRFTPLLRYEITGNKRHQCSCHSAAVSCSLILTQSAALARTEGTTKRPPPTPATSSRRPPPASSTTPWPG